MSRHAAKEEIRHPHADAIYRTYRKADATFGIVVTIPDTEPTKITGFQSRSAAYRWIENHKQTVSHQKRFIHRAKFGRVYWA